MNEVTLKVDQGAGIRSAPSVIRRHRINGDGSTCFTTRAPEQQSRCSFGLRSSSAYRRAGLFVSFIDPLVSYQFVCRQSGESFAGIPLPSWSVRGFAIAITVWEPIVGGLLLCGFRTRDALVAGGLLIAALVFGTAVRGDFTVLTEQLVYALIFFVLLLYRRENDRWSVDQFIAQRSIGAKA
jgi:uncharacterized membrane protein YphA (DoxX/SURF4 family)